MAVTGWKTCGTGSNVDRSGAQAWTNPTNITADDTNYATNDIPVESFTDWLIGSNFGFTVSDVPSGATIDGIEVRITWQGEDANVDQDAIHIDTQATTGPPASTNKSTGADLPNPFAATTFGGAADTWGLSLTDTQVRGTGMSAWISIANDKTTFGARLAEVDFVEMRVHYTEATADIDITPPVGAIALAGQAPTVAATDDKGISAPKADVSLAGQVPSVLATADIGIAPPKGDIALAGQAPTIATTDNIALQPPKADVTLTGQAPAVLATADIPLEVPVGALALAGQTPTAAATADIPLEPPKADLSLAGQAPSLERSDNRFADPPKADIALTGSAPTIAAPANIPLEIPAGTVALAGQEPTVSTGVAAGIEIEPPKADITLTGFAPATETTGNVVVNVSAATVNIQITIDEYGPDGSYQNINSTVPKIGQSFTGDGNVLGNASFYMQRQTTTGNARAYLYTHLGIFGTSGIPTGAPLATSAAKALADLPASAGWVKFSFDGSYTLADGTNYFIAVEQEASGADFRVNYDGSSPTHPGNSARYVGGGWVAESSRDYSFRVSNAVPPSVETGQNINVPESDLTLTGYAPSITAAKAPIVVPKGDINLTGQTPTVEAATGIAVPAGVIALTGAAPTIEATQDIVLSVPKADSTLTSFAPTAATTADIPLLVPKGDISLTGTAPRIGLNVAVPKADIALGGKTPLVVAKSDIIVTPAKADFLLTAYAPSAVGPEDIDLIPSKADLSLIGAAPAIQLTGWLPVDPESSVWTPKSGESSIWTPTSGESSLWTSRDEESSIWTPKSKQTTSWD